GGAAGGWGAGGGGAGGGGGWGGRGGGGGGGGRRGPARGSRARRGTSSASAPSSPGSSHRSRSVHALAGQRAPERLALQRLHTLELLRRRHEGRLLGRQDPAHAVVGPVEDRADLRVDRPRGLLAVVALATHPHALEEERGALTERRQPHAFGHAVLRDHQARDLRRTLEVVVRARRDLAVDQLLGHAAAEEHRDAVLELAPRQEEAILGRQLVGHPERRDTPRD